MIDDYLSDDVEILGYAASTVGTWGSSGTWTVSATVKGVLRYTGGREIYISDKDTVRTTHRLYVKETTALSEKNRVQVDGRVYDVKNVAAPIKAEFYQVDLDYLPDIAVTT